MKLKYLVYIAILLISVSLVSAGLFDNKGLLNVPLDVKEKLCIDTDAHKSNPESKTRNASNVISVRKDATRMQLRLIRNHLLNMKNVLAAEHALQFVQIKL